jgi:hypothetical protein
MRWIEGNNLEYEELELPKAGKEIVKVESFLPKLPLDEALVESFIQMHGGTIWDFRSYGRMNAQSLWVVGRPYAQQESTSTLR